MGSNPARNPGRAAVQGGDPRLAEAAPREGPEKARERGRQDMRPRPMLWLRRHVVGGKSHPSVKTGKKKRRIGKYKK